MSQKKLNTALHIIVVTLFSVAGCSTTFPDNKKLTGYNLSKPDAVFTLPEVLHEVSGVTHIDDVSFGFIQDENGILFIHDALENKPLKQLEFHINGDYEGITRVKDTIYVLRSDGNLFEIKDYQSANFRMDSIVTGIQANNNEGLCYDEMNHRLLVAVKGKIGKGPEFKDRRVIYGFDLTTKKLSDDPVFEFDLQTIKKFALDNKIDIPTQRSKKGNKPEPVIKFKTSEIAIHPITGKLFLLSASDHLFFIFNMNGTLEHIEALDPVRFNKAEGITFFSNGDMLITNEGQDKKPTLLRFNYSR